MHHRSLFLSLVVTVAACNEPQSVGAAASGSASTFASVTPRATVSAPAPDKPPPKSRAEPKRARATCHQRMTAWLEALPEVAKVTFYVNRKSAEARGYVDALTKTKQELEPLSNGRLEITIVEPVDAAQEEQAKQLELHELPGGYMGAALRYGTHEEVVPLLSTDDIWGTTYWLVGQIQRLRARAGELTGRVGVVAADGMTVEDGAPLTARRVAESAFPNMLADVDLAEPIDPKLGGLVLLQRDSDWSDDELAKIDRFMTSGDKTLLVLAGAVNTKSGDASMQTTLSTRRLDQLLSAYGIEMGAGVIVDEKTRIGVSVQTASGDVATLGSPGILLAGPDPIDPHPSLFRVDEVAFPFPAALTLHRDRQPRATFSEVVRSSATSRFETTDGQALKPSAGPFGSGPQRQHVIAASVSGELRAAFGEGSAANSRVLVFSAPQMLLNPYRRAAGDGAGNLALMAGVYDQQQLPNTARAWVALLTWMVSDDGLTTCSKLHDGTGAQKSDAAMPSAKSH